MTPEEFFADSPLGLATYERVAHVFADVDDAEVRTSKSQVAFRRRRGFAQLWRPGQYLSRPRADVVLSIGTANRLASDRFKEVVQPSGSSWQHHLEVRDADEFDDEVVGWLRQAYDDAG